MNSWKVTEVLGGNKIKVLPNWKWKDQSGHTVLIIGYAVSLTDLPQEAAENLAKNRLISTIKDKEIVLKNPIKIDGDGVLHCEVYLNEVDVSKYFVDFNKV
jgi:hypothetical protein